MRNPGIKRKIKFKEGVNPEDFFFLDPCLVAILGAAATYYEDLGVDFVITSLTDGVHKTETHAECRGVDVRIWGLSPFHLNRLVYHINKQYAEKFGTGPGGETPNRVAVLEKDHIHFQVARR